MIGIALVALVALLVTAYVWGDLHLLAPPESADEECTEPALGICWTQAGGAWTVGRP